MISKPRKIAHIGLGLVIIGVIISLVTPMAYWISLGIWALSVIAGVFAIIANGRAFPTTAQVVSGIDREHLDLLGYIEVYLAILPLIATIAIVIFGIIVKNSG